MIACDGFAMIIDGHFLASGAVPEEGALHALSDFIGAKSLHDIYATDHLVAAFPPALAFKEISAGVMAIPIVSITKSYLYFFRAPWDHQREWAGDPRKVNAVVSEGNLLRPRTSFAAWTEQVRGRSKRWTAEDVRLAQQLRVSLREVVFKKSDAVSLARFEASAKQDVLIAELNHRVRNILGLVRGLVSQSHGGVTHVEDFIESISGRIQTLARPNNSETVGRCTAEQADRNRSAALPDAWSRATDSQWSRSLTESSLISHGRVGHPRTDDQLGQVRCALHAGG